MIPIVDLFETHVTVRNLEAAMAFYGETLGLELAHVVPERRVAFFWMGGRGQAMIGLWEAGAGPQRMHLHFAFRVEVADILAAPRHLREAGISPTDFFGAETDEPSVLAWMPAASVYFNDPDGNSLEYLAMLPEPSRPEWGIISWSEWTQRHAGV